MKQINKQNWKLYNIAVKDYTFLEWTENIPFPCKEISNIMSPRLICKL